MSTTTHAAPFTPAREAEDPELLALPAPPKRERSLAVALLLFTAAASLAMIVGLRRDAAYAFSARSAVDVGDLGSLTEGAPANRLVRAQVMLGAARAIRYERPLVAESYRLMPVAGRPDVWVEVRVPERAENARFVPPSRVEGRLVRFEASGPKHRGLAAAVAQVTGQAVPENAWLVVDGEHPEDARAAVMLVALFGAFAAWSVIATRRLLRKVP